MGTQFIARNVDAEAFAREYAAPVRRNLEAWHFLNTSAAKASRNYAPGKPSGFVVGAPVESAGFMTFKGLANYIQTATPETAEQTFFSVVRSADTFASDANRPMFYGTFKQPLPGGTDTDTTFGCALYATTATGITATAGRGNTTADDTAAGVSLAGQTLASWSLIVQTVYADLTPTTTKNETDGATGTASASALPRLVSAGKYRIGSGFLQFGGLTDMAFFAAYSAVLTASEKAAVVADIRAQMLRRGVVV